MRQELYVPMSAAWCSASCNDNKTRMVLVTYREEFETVIDNCDGSYTTQWFYESAHDAYVLYIMWENGIDIGIVFTKDTNGYLLETPAAQNEFSLLLMSERPSFKDPVFTGKNIVIENLRLMPHPEAGWPGQVIIN